MEFNRRDLRRCDQALDPIDLDIGLAVALHLRDESRFDMPRISWRWKNRSPLMPSGARMIEQGRP